MKSEGRQHGFVRTGMIHPSGFGESTKAQSKPTNHSKLTGKCERSSKYSNCHVLPAMKSTDKSKGRRKLQPTGFWAEDKLGQLTGSGSSSVGSILDTLCGDDYDGHDDDY